MFLDRLCTHLGFLSLELGVLCFLTWSGSCDALQLAYLCHPIFFVQVISFQHWGPLTSVRATAAICGCINKTHLFTTSCHWCHLMWFKASSAHHPPLTRHILTSVCIKTKEAGDIDRTCPRRVILNVATSNFFSLSIVLWFILRQCCTIMGLWRLTSEFREDSTVACTISCSRM